KNHFLDSKAIQKLVLTALKSIDRKEIKETLPQHIIDKYHFPAAGEALVTAHFPKDMPTLDKALARLKFEELFYIQLAILRQANQFRSKAMGHPFSTIGHYFNTFYKECLPFDLTDAQKRVLREIRADVRGPGQMNRLLQGDVGSGKTIVALLSMLMAIDNDYQACIVAPTEILATQHYESMSKMLEPLGLEVRLLTGSTRKKEREYIADGLTSGSLKILVGTHAVFEDKVQFAKLGIVIIDEQHRFGVAQRAKLWGKNVRPPHVLVMTATPIPRTLAMTLYGDLDVSVIDQLPPGRKPIQTEHVFDEKRPQLNNFLRRQMAQGRQVYVVYPLIKESEKSDMKDLENGFEAMKNVFKEFTVCMVHGKMKPAEKEAQMQEFISGRANMLVSTTVIEVGVNVPNATVMVIENAERFGLSQLHQLRGRVGRGGDQSYCLLITKYQISSDTRKRIDIMTQTTNGFEIAEADLRLRGPGDLEGTLQSGLPFNLRVADLSRDGALLTMARDEAEQILTSDPMLSQPQNTLLLNQLHSKTKNVVNWSFIS
ncbi:MAG: ATP-dependent DNA helicase RecG, partial [Paludibacteraceae bacterium]|nr:ATP-dependent DNA helicase RecG [Paludibacteraceae bacterium]